MQTQKKPVLRFGKLATLAALVAIAGCITVNVNFPESAVERAADNFVRDLYKSPTATAEAGTGAADAESASVKSNVKRGTKKKTGKLPAAAPATTPAATDAAKPTSWHFELFASAYAQEINTATPKANEIKARMRGRVTEISEWKSKGVICETSDAMLVVKNAGKAGADAAAVAKLVKQENADRDELYEEIQSANKINDRKQEKIRKFFAKAFKDNSPPGTCFE